VLLLLLQLLQVVHVVLLGWRKCCCFLLCVL
jgi:hypothetical protein